MPESNAKKTAKDEPRADSYKVPESEQFANFRMYHQSQYERIDKLEARREFFSNFVITLSSAIFVIGFSDIAKLNAVNGTLLPSMIVLMNWVSIIFIRKSRIFIKMHQDRAKGAREMFAPELNQINQKVGKIDSGKDRFRREMLYIYVHILIIVITISASIYILMKK